MRCTIVSQGPHMLWIEFNGTLKVRLIFYYLSFNLRMQDFNDRIESLNLEMLDQQRKKKKNTKKLSFSCGPDHSLNYFTKPTKKWLNSNYYSTLVSLQSKVLINVSQMHKEYKDKSSYAIFRQIECLDELAHINRWNKQTINKEYM